MLNFEYKPNSGIIYYNYKWHIFSKKTLPYDAKFVLILRVTNLLMIIISLTDIVVPGTNTTTNSQGSRIPAGENVLVIKTPRGIYLRTQQGKIFAVRTSPKDSAASVSDTTAHGASDAFNTTAAGQSTLATTTSTSTVTSCSSYGETLLYLVLLR